MSTRLAAFVWDGCYKSGMKATKIVIMARLADYSNDDGVCWSSVKTIARQIGCGYSTASTAMKELEKEGWFSKIQRRKGNRNDSNIYTLNIKKLRHFFDMLVSDDSDSEYSKSDSSESEYDPLLTTSSLQNSAESRNAAKYKFSEDDFKTAEWMFTRIQKLHPVLKRPNFKLWANDVRLMVENTRKFVPCLTG